MLAYGMSEKGPVRDNNEDSFAYETIGNYFCMAVADGVGGESCGEIASRLAVETVMRTLKDSLAFIDSRDELPQFLKVVFNRANIVILHNCLENRERMGMCTTLTVALMKGTELTIAHLGDTRGYLLHGSELIKLTEDHNEAAKLVKNGLLSEDEAKVHPGRSRLFKVVGENQYLNPDIYSYNISYGDLVFLCSDGLSNMIEDKDILEIVTSEESLESKAAGLIATANENGGSDNISVVLIAYEQ